MLPQEKPDAVDLRIGEGHNFLDRINLHQFGRLRIGTLLLSPEHGGDSSRLFGFDSYNIN
jgi:hypothetical protein